MDPADPELPMVPLVPVIAPLGGPPESRVPEVQVVVAAPALAAPARAFAVPARAGADAAGTVTDLERVVVLEALRVPGAPVPVRIEASPVSDRPQTVPDNDIPARPESFAGDPAVPEQARTSARDLSPQPQPANAAGIRPDAPKGPDWAPRPGDPAAIPVQARGAGPAPEAPRPLTAEVGAPALAPKDAERSAPSLGDGTPSAFPAVGSRVAPSAPRTVAPAANPPVAASSASEEQAAPQPVATPAVQLRSAPADAAMPELQSSPVPGPAAYVARPEAPVSRSDAPARILSDARRPSAPEPAAVAAPVASPAMTERSLAPAEVAAPAPAMDRAVAREMRETARSDPGVVATTMPARPTETANAALQVPDIAVQLDVPELSAPRATEAPGVPSSSAPVAAPDVDVRRSVVDQLLATVRATSAGTVEIMLSPEELGQVRLDMKMVDGVMMVRIDAERPETLDLMRRGADVLFRELRDAGFGALNLSFGSGTPQRGGFASSGHAAGRPDRDTHIDVQAATAPSSPARGLGPARLDIRI
jgi:flagellar hook-length control protein FliK